MTFSKLCLSGLFAICMLLGGSAPTKSVAPSKYTIDASHTSVMFSIGHLGISKTYGMFRKVSGNFTLTLATPVAVPSKW